MRSVAPGSHPDIRRGSGFQPVLMRCVESLSVPFSGVTSLIVPGLDPVPGADLEHR
jgi:hypothetical protein